MRAHAKENDGGKENTTHMHLGKPRKLTEDK